MNESHAFLHHYSDSIACTLECFDRVIFKGNIRALCYPGGVRKFVDRVLKIRRKDFMPWAKAQSDRISEHAKGLARSGDRPYFYLRKNERKDVLAQKCLRENPVDEGLVCVLSCLEHCPSFRLVRAKHRPDFAFARPLAQVFYLYYFDKDLGLIHIRVPTLFPWSIQIAVNGHDYLAQQMVRARMGFVQEDNVLVELDAPEKAQKLADGFVEEAWPKRLRQLARRVLPQLWDVLAKWAHYWVIDQAEYATDVLFSSRAKLQALYPRLVDHALLHFQAPDILQFLGRRLHVRYDGEVVSDCKKDRLPGTRIKHRAKNNWIKMYDKNGIALRIETVINNSREFKVRRQCIRRGKKVMAWVPMNKGVSNLYRYRQAAQAANGRYLQALAAVEPPPPAASDLQRLAETCRVADRPYAGFNPARPSHLKLFETLCQAQHLLNGFVNADLRRQLFHNSPDPEQRRRDSAAVGRILKRLHVRGLVLKIPHSRRWHLTARGRILFARLLRDQATFTAHPTHNLAA